MPIILPTGDGGEARRDAALNTLEAHRPALVRDIRRTAVRLALTGNDFTADDVRSGVVIPVGIDPRVVGAAVRMLATAGLIALTGDYRRSTRPVAHCRIVPVWKLADRAKAIAWLAANPTPDA